jgi:urease accessory protein
LSATLQRLFTWISPAFPVGAFAWSQGLETAIADGRVRTAVDLSDWIDGVLTHGGLKTDAIVLAHAHRAEADSVRLQNLAELLLALTPSSERIAETIVTGGSFALAARAWPSEVRAQLPSPCPYPVAVGAIAGVHGLGLEETLLGYLTAAVQAQVSVAVRLVPLGQTAGLQVIAALEPALARCARAAISASLDEIGGVAYAQEIAQMRHETLDSRVFRS